MYVYDIIPSLSNGFFEERQMLLLDTFYENHIVHLEH